MFTCEDDPTVAACWFIRKGAWQVKIEIIGDFAGDDGATDMTRAGSKQMFVFLPTLPRIFKHQPLGGGWESGSRRALQAADSLLDSTQSLALGCLLLAAGTVFGPRGQTTHAQWCSQAAGPGPAPPFWNSRILLDCKRTHLNCNERGFPFNFILYNMTSVLLSNFHITWLLRI